MTARYDALTEAASLCIPALRDALAVQDDIERTGWTYRRAGCQECSLKTGCPNPEKCGAGNFDPNETAEQRAERLRRIEQFVASVESDTALSQSAQPPASEA